MRNGSVNPMTSPFLILTVVEKADSRGRRALYSKDRHFRRKATRGYLLREVMQAFAGYRNCT